MGLKTNLVDIKSDGSIWLNQKYFNYAVGLRMIHLFIYVINPVISILLDHSCIAIPQLHIGRIL